MMFMMNEFQKDFSKKHEQLEQEDEGPIDPKNMKAKKEKMMKEFTLKIMLHPWFIQNKDKSTNIPVNTMDCIRIFDNLKQLKDKTGGDSSLWSPLHLCQFFLVDMTVVMDNKPDQQLILVRGKTSETFRGPTSLRADASNCNLKGKWPKVMGEYAKLWAFTYKGDKFAEPSIK